MPATEFSIFLSAKKWRAIHPDQKGMDGNENCAINSSTAANAFAVKI